MALPRLGFVPHTDPLGHRERKRLVRLALARLPAELARRAQPTANGAAAVVRISAIVNTWIGDREQRDRGTFMHSGRPCYGKPMTTEIVPGITADPEIAFGKPVIADTRTPAAAVLSQIAAGVPEDVLCDEYDLTREQIRAALRYGAWLAEHEVIRASTG